MGGDTTMSRTMTTTTATTTTITTPAPTTTIFGTLAYVGWYLWNFRFLPLRYRWRVNKYKNKLIHPTSPLALRRSLCCIRSLRDPPEPRPYLRLLRMFWPLPSWRWRAELPRETPREIAADRARYTQTERDLIILRSVPVFRWRDTPQRALYRLYYAVCANDEHAIVYEVEYIWRHKSAAWRTTAVEDPRCEDPEQYAVLASIVEELVDAFMWRLELGLRRFDSPVPPPYTYEGTIPLVPETCPAWTARVPPLGNRLVLDPRQEDVARTRFGRRNILNRTGYFYTV